jgi:hypothetical protein
VLIGPGTRWRHDVLARRVKRPCGIPVLDVSHPPQAVVEG